MVYFDFVLDSFNNLDFILDDTTSIDDYDLILSDYKKSSGNITALYLPYLMTEDDYEITTEDDYNLIY